MNHFLAAASLDELKEFLHSIEQKPYRAAQIYDWIWKKQVLDPLKMKNIGKDLQEQLRSSWKCELLQLLQREDSQDKETEKFLFKLHDGLCIESVLIRSFSRNTVCISSQVGCPIGCTFCASGKNGCLRDLHAAEIVAQVLFIQKYLHDQGQAIHNIVYMGMGEPLRNYEQVVSSIKMLIDPERGGFSRRRITLSTVGIIENITRLTEEDLGINLALSLHAPSQELRQKIIPYIRRYSLKDLLTAVDRYQEKTGRDITYEYILIDSINDRAKDAYDLCRLLAGKRGCVNLIPYNPIPGMEYKKPSKESVRKFCEILEEAHIPHTCRYTKGDDIAAACGQLALRKESL